MKRKLFMPFLMAMFLVIAPLMKPAAAQTEVEVGPAVVVSIAGIDNQFADVKYAMEKAGFADMAMTVEPLAEGYFRGVDRTQPACIALYFTEGSPEPNVVGYVPVTNLDDVLDTLSDYAPIDESGDVIKISAPDGTQLNLKEADGYALFSDSAELFDRMPTTPVSILEGMPDSSNLAFRVYGQRIPATMRQQAIDLMRQGLEGGMRGMEEDGPGAQNVEAQMAQLEELINETESLTFAFDIDPDAKGIRFDMAIQGTPESRISKQAAAGASKKTMFSGFLAEDAAIAMNACSAVLPEDVEQVRLQMTQMKELMLEQMKEESNMPDEEFEFVKSLFSDCSDLLLKTMEEGVFDVGLIGYLDAEQINIAAGGRIADSEKFEETVRTAVGKLQEKAAEDGVELEVSFDDSTHSGVTFHKIVVPVPESEDEARQIFGESATALIGVGDEAVYFGFGQQPLDVLTSAIDRSKSASGTAPAMRMDIAIAPLLEFAHRFQKDEALSEAAAMLKEEGNAKIRIVAEYVENGQSMTFEIQEGLLKMIGVFARQMGRPAAPAGEDF